MRHNAQTGTLGRRLIMAAVAVLLALQPLVGAAQIFGRSRPKDTEPENVFIRPEREVLQQLSRAEKLLQDGRYGDAVRMLNAVLEQEEDYFFLPEKDATEPRSLKTEAQRLIGQMPRRGLDAYRLQFGAEAKQLLDEAVISADVKGLAAVSRQYFHTEAGHEATFLLGLDHLNHARPLAAALTLQRLHDASRDADRFEPMLSLAAATAWLQAGMPEKAQDLLVKLKNAVPDRTIPLAGRQVALFDENAKAVEWLADLVGPVLAAARQEPDRWLMLHGNPTRTARREASAPLLNMLWHVPAADDPLLSEALRQLRQLYVEQDLPTLPGLHPLAVDDVVLMRTARNLLAVDFESGKRLWEVPVDDQWGSLLGKTTPESLLRQQPHWALGLGQRMWDDITFGTLSSDGRLVFSIEDLAMGVATPSGRTVIVNGRMVRNAPQAPSNRLAAHDIRTGKLKWHLGGPGDQFALRQAETFFLGPPLPLMGQLYVLAESKSEVVLLALDAQTGDLLWKQPLAAVESTLLEDPLRRMAGISPSYAEGLLICPTSVGAVVAVDLAARSLLWGYRYPRDQEAAQQAMIIRFNSAYQQNQSAPLRWTDGTAMIANGKVLITPVESNEIHCLNLLDGKKIGSQKRQDDLYLACIHNDKAILVGRKFVRAVPLKDGLKEDPKDESKDGAKDGLKDAAKDVASAWGGKMTEFPNGATPSGRGFVSNDKYYLPLSNAEVIAIDLANGEIVERVKSRKGDVPGNLVCYRGRIISQGCDGVETFYQRRSAEEEVHRRLAADAADPVALALEGEILLDQNKRGEAIDRFRRAFAKDGDPRTKGLLRDALLDGLRTQFADYRDRVPEVETLLDDDSQRAGFLRVMAEGLQSVGQYRAAFEQYVKLMELDGVGQQLEAVSAVHSVRRDRWVQARLGQLVESAKDRAVREELAGAIRQRLEAAVASGEVEPLRRCLDYFGDHAMTVDARRELARRLAKADRLIEAEMVLWRDQRSSDPAVAGPALAMIAQMLREAGREEDAALCYRRLANEFAAVECLDGKTGRQLVDALDAASPVRQAVDAGLGWPQGVVKVEKPKVAATRHPTYGRFGVRYDGSPGPFFKDVTVQFDQNQRTVLARDGLGNELWRVSLADGQNNNFYFNRATIEGAVHGHLLVMSLGWKILAIDAAGNATTKGGRLLWDHDLNSLGIDLIAARNMNAQIFGAVPWAFQQMNYSRTSNRMNGVGPVTSRILCFQRFRNLVAIDPVSGAPLWTQGQIPLNSELFGDDEYVFVLPRDQTEATVYRALDGARLGTRKIPRSSPGSNEYYHDARGVSKYVPMTVSCLAAFGRQMVLWRRDGSQRLLEMYDPWEERTVWGPLRFSEQAQVDAIDNEAVAVCEGGGSKGRLVLVTLPDGKKLVDTTLEVDGIFGTPQNVSLMRYEDGYLVVTHYPQARSVNSRRNIQPLPGMMMQPITSGWAFAFDVAGQPAWPAPVRIENQQLAPDQPGRSPLLVFAAQEYVSEGGRAKNQLLVQCLDKRTGRKVCDEKFDGSTGSFEVVADPKEKTVEVRFQQQTLVLKLTDEPLPPEPPPVKVEKPKTSPIKALMKALQKSASEFDPSAPPPREVVEEGDPVE